MPIHSDDIASARPIALTGFADEPERLVQDELAATERVIRRGWYILGPEVEDFEKAWSTYLGAPHTIGVANGMDAIEISLRALDIGPGAEVITTPVTAFATVLAVIRAGAKPVLADVDPGTGLLDIASVKRCLTPKTKALLPVHLYGNVVHLDEWAAVAAGAGCSLIEDCAQAHGARWNGRAAGTFGVCGAFSFYPTKNLGALGDAGAIVTSSDSIRDRSRVLRNYGQSERYHHVALGLNSRLDELHAAMLGVRLRWLDQFTGRRRAIAKEYRARLRNEAVVLLDEPEHPENHVYHLFVVKCDARDRLLSYLWANGIHSLIHYPVPVHEQPPCLDLRRDPAGLMNAERFARQCLSLPCHPQMSDADVDTVIDVVNSFA